MRKTFCLLMLCMLLFAACTSNIPIAKEDALNVSDSSALAAPVVELLRWPQQEVSARGDFTLVPETFVGSTICVDTVFILTLSHPQQSLPVVVIDGQVNPLVTRMNDTQFVVTPQNALSYNALYVFRIDGSDASWVFQTVMRLQVTGILPGHQSINVPVTTAIEINFSLPVVSIEDNFSIAPHVDGRFITRGNSAIFMPTNPLDFAQVYTVTLSGGIASLGANQVMHDNLSFSFETESESARDAANQAQASVQFFNQYFEVNSFDPPQLSFWLNYDARIMSRPQINVRIYRFTDTDFAVRSILNQQNIPFWAMFAQEQAMIDVRARGIRHEASFNLRGVQGDEWQEVMTFPNRLPAGFYVVNASVGDNVSQVILQVTDLSVQVLADAEQMLVWANDMQNGTALSDTTVSFNHQSAAAVTNEHGLAMMPVDTSVLSFMRVDAVDGRSCFVFFGQTTPISPLPIGSNPLARAFTDWAWPTTTTVDESYWSVLQLDRTLFQRSDTVYFWGFVQHRSQQETIRELTAVLTQNTWGMEERTVLHLQTVYVNNGVYFGDIALPNLSPGFYNLMVYHGDVLIGSTFFSVEDFVKPPYQMLVSADRQAMFLDETANFTIRTEFFEGTPVSDLNVSYNIWGWPISNNIRASARTNQEGEVSVNSGALRVRANDQGMGSLVFSAEATLPEIGPTWQQTEVMVFINDIHVQGNASREGADASLNIQVDNIDISRLNDGTAINQNDFLGTSVANQIIETQIVRVWWESVRTGERFDTLRREVVPIFRYDRREEVIERFTLTTDGNGFVSHNFTVPNTPHESYIARISTTDGNGRAITHDVFIGRDFTSFWWNAGDDMVFLDVNREWDERYQLGDMVEAAVMRGTETLKEGNFLFVVSNMGILDVHVGTNPFHFEFSEAHIPGATIHAFYFNGRMLESGWNMQQSIDFDRDTRLMNVVVSVDQAVYGPGDTVQVTVHTYDMHQNRVPAHVNIAVVDEALFALRNNVTDTLQALYRWTSTGIVHNFSTHNVFGSAFRLFGLARAGSWTAVDSAAPSPAAMSVVTESEQDSSVGGGVTIREIFENTAYFRSLQTSAQGVYQFTFTLPDNITSWRVTASALTNDLYAGNAFENIRVTMPMFLHHALGNVFLVGDVPYVGVNIFGTDLSADDRVTFEVINEQDAAQVRTVTGYAFERVNVPLWAMAEGEGSFVITARTESGFADAVRHEFVVIASHQTVDQAVFYDVTADTVFEVGTTGMTDITFTDRGRGQFLWELMGMRFVRSARLEEMVMRREANRLLQEHFPNMRRMHHDDAFNVADYQMSDGGLSILPHGSSDLRTTVRVMSMLLDDVDVHALRNYLYMMLASDGDNTLLALYGLAQLGDPVLDLLHEQAQRSDLTIMDAAYLALGFAAIGDAAMATQLFNQYIAEHLQTMEPYIRVNVGNTRMDTMSSTSVVSILAAKLNLPEADGLFLYTARHNANDVFTQLGRLVVIQERITHLESAPAAIIYRLFGEELTRDLSHGNQFRLQIPAQNFDAFEIISVTGNVGAVSMHSVPVSDVEAIDNDITVTRQFFRVGSNTPTTTFEQGDLVRVQITVDYSRRALTGSYKITDFLPAGLTLVQNSARFDTQGRDQGWVWATAEGQRVMFFDFNSRFNNIRTYHYFARVISPGTFTAEGTILQNLSATAYLTVSDDVVITINP